METINGSLSVDGSLQQELGGEEICRRHPDKKIVFILNRVPRGSALGYIKKTIDGYLNYRMYGRGYFKQGFVREREFKKEITRLNKRKNTVIIKPSRIIATPATTNKIKLRAAYRQGLKTGQLFKQVL
jgi:predicted patatin/cPLA2 family phospholipase